MSLTKKRNHFKVPINKEERKTIIKLPLDFIEPSKRAMELNVTVHNRKKKIRKDIDLLDLQKTSNKLFKSKLKYMQQNSNSNKNNLILCSDIAMPGEINKYNRVCSQKNEFEILKQKFRERDIPTDLVGFIDPFEIKRSKVYQREKKLQIENFKMNNMIRRRPTTTTTSRFSFSNAASNYNFSRRPTKYFFTMGTNATNLKKITEDEDTENYLATIERMYKDIIENSHKKTIDEIYEEIEKKRKEKTSDLYDLDFKMITDINRQQKKIDKKLKELELLAKRKSEEKNTQNIREKTIEKKEKEEKEDKDDKEDKEDNEEKEDNTYKDNINNKENLECQNNKNYRQYKTYLDFKEKKDTIQNKDTKDTNEYKNNNNEKEDNIYTNEYDNESEMIEPKRKKKKGKTILGYCNTENNEYLEEKRADVILSKIIQNREKRKATMKRDPRKKALNSKSSSALHNTSENKKGDEPLINTNYFFKEKNYYNYLPERSYSFKELKYHKKCIFNNDYDKLNFIKVKFHKTNPNFKYAQIHYKDTQSFRLKSANNGGFRNVNIEKQEEIMSKIKKVNNNLKTIKKVLVEDRNLVKKQIEKVIKKRKDKNRILENFIVKEVRKEINYRFLSKKFDKKKRQTIPYQLESKMMSDERNFSGNKINPFGDLKKFMEKNNTKDANNVQNINNNVNEEKLQETVYKQLKYLYRKDKGNFKMQKKFLKQNYKKRFEINLMKDQYMKDKLENIYSNKGIMDYYVRLIKKDLNEI